MKNTVRLGFKVGTGVPVDIPIAHLCVTGQTQLSGKTTTLEALIARSGRKAIAFVTKRGEGAFAPPAYMTPPAPGKSEVLATNRLQPYFRHRADWQFVSDILGAILSEKLKWHRPWIMKLCRGAKTLRDVADRIPDQLHGNKEKKIKPARGIAEGVYTELDEYFQMLLPEIERLPYTDKLELRPGLNVMDLSAYSPALQMLVISATIDRINQAEKNVIVVIPEAWEFVPSKRSSPVKSAAIALARKGAALGNFMWLDSQDLASIDTEVRRACSVWILGVQREQNEVKRMLAHITDAPKPKVDDVMQLEKGQFFVCHGKAVTKVYVQPAWMGEADAIIIAQGNATVDDISKNIYDVEAPHTASQPTDTIFAGTPEGWIKSRHGQLDRLNKQQEPVAGGDIKLDNTPKLRDYATMPAGLSYIVDDDIIQEPEDHRGEEPGGPNYAAEFHRKEEEQMDAAKEAAYQRQISDLTFTVATLKEKLNLPLSVEEVGMLTGRALLVGEADPRPSADSAPMLGRDGFELLVRDLLTDEDFRAGIRAMIPTNGVIKVEPREVVLKQFLSQEVDRILDRAESLSRWQKGIIKLLEARGSGMKRGELFKRVGGKDQNNYSGTQQKDMKAEIVELGTRGFIKWDSSNSYATPNLENMVKAELAAYNPTEDDVKNCIGQVLLKLK